MLVQFSVANFRSFNQEQTLDLTASNYFNELPENTFKPNKRKKLSLLKAVGIYGANASGKSSLINALWFMRQQVAKLDREPNEAIDTKPFKLSRATTTAPSQFEILFIADNKQYQYGFCCTEFEFTQEWLLINGKSVLERNLNETSGEFEYPILTLSEGDKVGIDGWKKFASNPNSLFVPKAASNGSQSLEPVITWFRKLVITEGFNERFSSQRLDEPEWNQRILAFLHQMGLQDIQRLSTRSVDISKLHIPNGVSEKTKALIERDFKSRKEVMLERYTLDDNEFVTFDLDDESQGTRALFCFAYPLLDILDKDLILIVDEIDNSLHPLVVQKVVHYFQSMCPDSKAQLIFTTHDASLLSKNLLRRDQVWFAEKNPELSTDLYSLEQFSPRKEEAIEKRYLSGRYGGVPILPDLDHHE